MKLRQGQENTFRSFFALFDAYQQFKQSYQRS